MLLLNGSPIFAQQPSRDGLRQDSIHAISNNLPTNQKDLTDYVKAILHKKNKQTDSLKNVYFSVLPAVGYSLQTGWAVNVSANTIFKTQQKNDQIEKESSILSSITLTQYKQIIFPFQADIWTKNNRYNLITDCRYLKYPSVVYNLGARSKTGSGYNIDYGYIKLHQTVLRNIAKNLYAGLGIYYDHFWNIKEIDPPANTITSFQKYGFKSASTASGGIIKLLYDSRINPINSNNGWYINMLYRINSTVIGSDNNWQSALIELRKFIHFPSTSKNVLALWSYNWLTLSGKPPFLLLPSVGWDDFYNTGRGYIQGRFRAKNMLYTESEYRFNITPNGFIGGVVFANAGSYSKTYNGSISVIEPGYGLGVRLKLNKHSGTNICIDYGFGNNGSRGIAVNLGEVF